MSKSRKPITRGSRIAMIVYGHESRIVWIASDIAKQYITENMGRYASKYDVNTKRDW